MSILTDRRGAALADVFVFIATLSLAAALLYPAWSAREFRARASTAISDVEVVSEAARRALAASGRWPGSASPGSVPTELVGLTREGGPFSRDGYRVGWTSWNLVDSVEVLEPPPAPEDTPPESAGPMLAPVARSVGGVTVHSGDRALLAELSRHFVDEPAFVLDTMWLLVLTERAHAPIAER